MSETAKPTPNTSHAEILRLVKDLDLLREGEQAVRKLVACGVEAIGPLKEFLFQGRPSGIYEPRRRAVAALASLGAKDVLIEYLLLDKQIPDPVARFGEEAVENAAARALAAWRTEDVFLVLLEVSRRRLLAGVVEALGDFGRMEAVPYLDRALEDDMCGAAAEEAFRKIGQAAGPALVLSALTPLPSLEVESPSSLRRRRSALGLLAEIGVSSEDTLRLSALFDEADPEIVVRTARLVSSGAGTGMRAKIVERLLAVLPSAHWSLHSEIEDCLVTLFDDVKPTLEWEISQRMALPEKQRVFDSALGVLLRVKRRAEALKSRSP
jgi:hypothetical protein